MSELKPEQNISVEIVSGIEGLCLLVNDYRVAGPKPWGGGTVTQSFKTKLVDIERAIYGNRRAQPENEPLTLDELRQMDGEPVWMARAKKWVFVSTVVTEPYAQVWYFFKGFVYTVLYYHEKFYRNKPERSEG